MSLSDVSGSLADRLKKAREKKVGPSPEDVPVNYDELYALRARMLGVLIRDGRIARSRSIDDCAVNIGVSAQTLVNWEYGADHPSLPQLELLAYDLNIPLSHFWASETMNNGHEHPLMQHEYVELRDRVIGGVLRQARANVGLSVDEVAEKTGLPQDSIKAYEMGERAIPLTELTSLAAATNVSMSHFMETQNRVGEVLMQFEQFKKFQDMPDDVQTFISNPINASFVSLAMWFSTLEVKELRGLAESILHLTRLDADKMQKIAESILNDITL